MITKPFEDFIGKPRQELYDHLIKEGYNLADEEDLEECIKNPPDYMKVGPEYQPPHQSGIEYRLNERVQKLEEKVEKLLGVIKI